MQAHLPQPANSPSRDGGDAAPGALANPGARWALAGFFLSGVLLSFLGAILPSWQHHISSEYGIISLYFVGLIIGLVGSAWVSPRLLAKRGIGWTLACACAV